MASIRREIVYAALKRADALVDYDICNTMEKQYKFIQQTILDDESLTEDEKENAIKITNEEHDNFKVIYNEGKKRICENCQLECFAVLYCECCIRNYLKAKFPSWTSGNVNIDNLIQKCQMDSISPDRIIEWIPYNNLRNIEYLTKGGCSEIYTAEWIGGNYEEWDTEEKQLKRNDTRKVILKRLENVDRANASWFDEATSHLTIGTKWHTLVKCFGLTQNPLNGDYMLIMNSLDMDLRKYLQENHNQLTWKKRIQITYDIIVAIARIYEEQAIHRDLHSGNILYHRNSASWYISDLGFCGPADKPLGCIYGNLSYIAPEVIGGKEYTYASDVYSFGMLMWEISAGQPPFSDYDYYDDSEFAINIIDGMRPKLILGTPSDYKDLMEQCWDADPKNRPDINTLEEAIMRLRDLYYQNENYDKPINNNSDSLSNTNSSNTNTVASSINSIVSISKIYKFINLPEPRNATKEEQKAFHDGKQYNPNEENLKENEGKNKLKRSFSSNSDGDKKEDTANEPKKIKLEDKKVYRSRQYDFDI